MKQFSHALVLGKFMPLHNGHVYLLDSAHEAASSVSVVLFSEATDPIPGETRLSWLTTLYPEATHIHHTDPLPRDPTGEAHWDTWLEVIKQRVDQEAIDVVVSSEDYGVRLAQDLDSAHVLVDKARTTVPISGSIIRENPEAFLHHLPEIVQTHFIQAN